MAIPIVARTLSGGWAGFCAFVVFLDVMATTPDATSLARAVMVGLGILFFGALALVPWRWEAVGGILLILVGVGPLIFIAVMWSSMDGAVLLASAVLGLMPLLAGGLFVAHAWTTRSRQDGRARASEAA